MKRIYTVFIILCITSCNSLVAQTQDMLMPLNDSVYSWYWDANNSNWSALPYKRMINWTYDNYNNLTGYSEQTAEESDWVNTKKYTFTYDVNNNKTIELIEQWNGTIWESLAKKIYTYDANNNLTNNLWQNWHDTAFKNSYNYSYKYDAYNNELFYLRQIWKNNAWENIYQRMNTYDTENNNIYYLTQEWNDSLWENKNQYSNEYDGKGNIIYSTWDKWYSNNWHLEGQIVNNYDTSDSLLAHKSQEWVYTEWVNRDSMSYTYDANNNRTSYLQQQWNGNNWSDLYKDTYSYDSFNKLLIESKMGSDGYNPFKEYVRLSYTYDLNNFTKSKTQSFFSHDSTNIEYGDSTAYYYHTVTVNTPVKPDMDVIIYPNPSLSSFNVETYISSNSTVSIEIWNTLGQLVYSFTEEGKTIPYLKTIDADLQKGIYYLKLQSDEGIITKKVEVLR